MGCNWDIFKVFQVCMKGMSSNDLCLVFIYFYEYEIVNYLLF